MTDPTDPNDAGAKRLLKDIFGGDLGFADVEIEHAARVAHEVNRAYCQTIGDWSQPNWDEAPDWQKQSAMSGVRHLIANPETTPEMSHQSWYDTKLADGWTYGEVKNPEFKTHPCMLPYDQLPHDQRTKDVLFLAAVRSVLGL